jgi:archaellum component FlaC
LERNACQTTSAFKVTQDEPSSANQQQQVSNQDIELLEAKIKVLSKQINTISSVAPAQGYDQGEPCYTPELLKNPHSDISNKEQFFSPLKARRNKQKQNEHQ